MMGRVYPNWFYPMMISESQFMENLSHNEFRTMVILLFLLYYMIAIQNLSPQAGFCIAFDKASSLLGSLGPSRQ